MTNKEWMTPDVEVLDVKETANGTKPEQAFDGDWVQIGGKWYKPGSSNASK